MIDYGAYYVGCPVKYIKNFEESTLHFKNFKPIAGGLIGHVVGYDLVEYDEGYFTIIKVQWADGRVFSIHPKNIERL